MRAINKAGRVWGDGMTAKVMREVVTTAARVNLPGAIDAAPEPGIGTRSLSWKSQSL